MNLNQRCKGRRQPHNRARLASLSLLLASASLGACGGSDGDDSAELQAILRDGDLTEVMRSMLTEAPAPKPDTGVAGGRGDMTGVGGTTGSLTGAGTPPGTTTGSPPTPAAASASNGRRAYIPSGGSAVIMMQHRHGAVLP